MDGQGAIAQQAAGFVEADLDLVLAGRQAGQSLEVVAQGGVADAEWMFRSMLGIDTDGVGFKKIVLKPEMGEGITWAKGHYDSIHGRIGSDWKRDNDQFSWKITVPANTTATVYVPAKDEESVSESGSPIAQVEGVTFLRMEKGRAVFEVGSGKYAFNTKMN